MSEPEKSGVQPCSACGQRTDNPRIEVRDLGGSWRLFVGDHCIAIQDVSRILQDFDHEARPCRP